MTRHEQGAAFMADMYGRLTGKAGVCLSTLGPGATNLITGVADANMDRAPLVALAGQASTDQMHKESHQYLDIIALFRPVTKWNTSLRAASIIPEAFRKAFKLAQTEKPGATLVEIQKTWRADHRRLPLRCSSYAGPASDQQMDRALGSFRRR
jgi:acetolactate synthase-1/2/3 large subunit